MAFRRIRHSFFYRNRDGTAAAHYNLIAAAVATLPAVATGLLAWQWQYGGKKLRGNLRLHLLFGSVSAGMIWLLWLVAHSAAARTRTVVECVLSDSRSGCSRHYRINRTLGRNPERRRSAGRLGGRDAKVELTVGKGSNLHHRWWTLVLSRRKELSRSNQRWTRGQSRGRRLGCDRCTSSRGLLAEAVLLTW